MNKYTIHRTFTDDDWPKGWGEADIEFLAEFVENELDARLLLDPTGDGEYVLLRKERSVNNISPSTIDTSRDLGPLGIEPDFGLDDPIQRGRESRRSLTESASEES